LMENSSDCEMGNHPSGPSGKSSQALRQPNPTKRNLLVHPNLPSRFEVKFHPALFGSLGSDIWLVIFRYIHVAKQFAFSRVCKSMYNTFWETRTGWQFDPDESTAFFDELNDEWISYLLRKCGRENLSWLSLNFLPKHIQCWDAIFEMSNLKKLNLADNIYLRSDDFTLISKLTNLTDLNISGCHNLQHFTFNQVPLETLRFNESTQVGWFSLHKSEKTVSNTLRYLEIESSPCMQSLNLELENLTYLSLRGTGHGWTWDSAAKIVIPSIQTLIIPDTALCTNVTFSGQLHQFLCHR